MINSPALKHAYVKLINLLLVWFHPSQTIRNTVSSIILPLLPHQTVRLPFRLVSFYCFYLKINLKSISWFQISTNVLFYDSARILGWRIWFFFVDHDVNNRYMLRPRIKDLRVSAMHGLFFLFSIVLFSLRQFGTFYRIVLKIYLLNNYYCFNKEKYN